MSPVSFLEKSNICDTTSGKFSLMSSGKLKPHPDIKYSGTRAMLRVTSLIIHSSRNEPLEFRFPFSAFIMKLMFKTNRTSRFKASWYLTYVCSYYMLFCHMSITIIFYKTAHGKFLKWRLILDIVL